MCLIEKSFFDLAFAFLSHLCYSIGDGALAQLGARNIRIVEARGSNPLYSTFPAESEHEKMFGFCTFHPIAKLLFPLHYDF